MVPLHEGVFTSLIQQLKNLPGVDAHVSCEAEKCSPVSTNPEASTSKHISEDWRQVMNLFWMFFFLFVEMFFGF